MDVKNNYKHGGETMNLEELLSLEHEKCEEFLRTLSPQELDTLQGEVLKRIKEIQEECRLV